MTVLIDTPDTAPSPPAAPRHDRLQWMPIRSLAPRHRPRIVAHLLALPEHDRYLRFGHAASDAMIGRYVDQIDFDHDEIFGIFNRRLELTAMAHLAFLGADRDRPNAAEFGVSVNPDLRGRGAGARLFEHAVLRARNRHVDSLIIHALSENTAMLHIVRRAGAKIVREGSDSTAQLGLPDEDFVSHLEVMAERQAAELDYGMKVHVRRFGDLMRRMAPWHAEG